MTSPITVIINGEAGGQRPAAHDPKGFAYTPTATRKYEVHTRLAAGDLVRRLASNHDGEIVGVFAT